jgi:hypothetical protein
VLGGAGGSGYDIENTIGGAGGAGAGTNVAQNNNTGLYGGGGAGAGNGTTGGTFAGGAGTQGVIFIVYTPSAGVTNNGRFFIFF